ncbi:MAG: DUF881 domain-containing protein [Anaerovoracaceae bacterium]|jgi:uncharacterized protein YlxW (UPF0749 family)
MMMKKTLVPLLIISLLLGLLLVVQTRNVAGQHLYVSSRAIKDYEVSIEGETRDLNQLKERLQETRDRWEEYQKIEAESEPLKKEMGKKLMEELPVYGASVGAFSLRGSGIEVYIDDETRDLDVWENPNDVLVHDEDLLMIINELKAAGAEAISINGQRLSPYTSISCAGHTIRINGQLFARPFEIMAIGDGARMSAALIGPGCPGTILMDYIIFKVKINDDILIPAYTEEYGFKYLTPILAGDREKEKTQ